MKKPVAIIDAEESQKIANLLKNEVSNEIGIDVKVNQNDERKRIGKGGQLYITKSLGPNSPQQIFARKMRDEDPNCARMLVTSVRDLVRQDIEYSKEGFISSVTRWMKGDKNKPKSSLLSMYYVHRGERIAPENINWEDFRGWFRRNYPTFHDIVIEREDENSLKTETKTAIDYLRQKRKIFQPISVGIVGLGKLGLGTLKEATKDTCISHAYVFTNFVNGNYEPLLGILERGRREKSTGGSLEDLFDANPDVLIISTGKHNIDYSQFKTRPELTKMLLETSIPKVKPVLEMALKRKFSGLIAMQTNPNSHLIMYARDLGIHPNQLTSFPPDTNRHIEELYKKIKELYPETKIREEDIHLLAIGDHMNGGIPLYSECTISGLKSKDVPLLEAFPQFQDKKLQEKVCKDARGVGLGIMQSAGTYKHDYDEVPKHIKDCLKDLAYFQEFSRCPIYQGILSVPVRFTYQGKGNTVEIRVQKAKKIADLTQDEQVREELLGEIDNIKELTHPYLKPKT